jgi:hypothetical protein
LLRKWKRALVIALELVLGLFLSRPAVHNAVVQLLIWQLSSQTRIRVFVKILAIAVPIPICRISWRIRHVVRPAGLEELNGLSV